MAYEEGRDEEVDNVSSIFVLGHSLSIIDQPYFREIIDSIDNESSSWIVTYYNDGEDDFHLNTLTTLGLQKAQITLVKMDDLKHALLSLF